MVDAFVSLETPKINEERVIRSLGVIRGKSGRIDAIVNDADVRSWNAARDEIVGRAFTHRFKWGAAIDHSKRLFGEPHPGSERRIDFTKSGGAKEMVDERDNAANPPERSE